MKIKTNALIENMKGQVGDLTLFVTKGQLVTRTINRTPKNPRTKKQMTQRVQYSNTIANFQIMAPFIRGSYENKPQKQSYCNTFIQQNLNVVKVYLTKNEAKAKACVVAPYNISMGTLQTIETTVQGNAIVTSMRLPQEFLITETTTVGQVAEAILSNNTSMNKGDQITIIHLIQKNILQGTTNIPKATSELHKFILDKASDTLFGEVIPSHLFTVKNGNIGTDENIEAGGIAYILSRKQESKLLLSTQSIVLTPGNTTYKKYTSEEQKIKAIQSYPAPNQVEKYADPGAIDTRQDPDDTYFAVTKVTQNSTIIPKGSGELNIAAGDTIEIIGTRLTEVEIKANLLTDPTGTPVNVSLTTIGTLTDTTDQTITIAVTMERADIFHLFRADSTAIIYNFSQGT